MKNLMIDYRDSDGKICRKAVDDMEFCVRDGVGYFASNDCEYEVPLENIIQMYTY